MKRVVSVPPCTIFELTLVGALFVLCWSIVALIAGYAFLIPVFVLIYIGLLAYVLHAMRVDHENRRILIPVPVLSDPAGPNRGFDPRSVQAARDRAVDEDGNPRLG